MDKTVAMGIITVAFLLGIVWGFAMCFYGVKVRKAPTIQPANEFGVTTYAAFNPQDVEVFGTRDKNPAASWRKFRSARGNLDSIKNYKGAGYTVKRVESDANA